MSGEIKSVGGLEDVIAAETTLSHVDGEAGRLILRGHDLEELAGRASFERVVSLLWAGLVPGAETEAALARALGEARRAAFVHFQPLLAEGRDLSPMERMRFLLASFPDGAREREPAALLGAGAVAAAIAIRAAQGEAPLAPDPTLGQAADLLRMIRGAAAGEKEIATFETYLVTVMDHGLNASTFAARVVASTAAGLASSIVAGIGALKGPLHGGAPGPVLDMLDAIGRPERAADWIAAALDRGERLMGLGHRVYRVRDPRADVLKAAMQALLARLGSEGNRRQAERLALAEAVEQAALAALKRRKSARRLDVNVEFYTALLLEALQIPRAGFTAVFAASRIAGWIAHVREQEASGRLIRPLSRYVGPLPVRAA